MTIVRTSLYPYRMAQQPGFTLVELIAVIVVVGVLGAIGGARFLGRSSFDSVAFADQTAALLRYAQKVAVAQNRNVHVSLGASGIKLCYQAGCAPGTHVLAPGGSNSASSATKSVCADGAWACEAPPEQVRVGPAVEFYFDPLGKPFAAADLAPTPVSTFATLAVTVSASESVRTITVERETGYVH